MANERLSPREFLKARRPERFSDSFIEETQGLDRSLLEYHLSTLTNRSQEIEFQTFARHLLQREVCPNLLPQTGPTGGGDSKVDAETYPVSDDLSLVWYVGKGREAASERWAFAFSAKETWRSKAQSDVAKIAATGRGYSKAFFVTNQFVRDKERAEVEDALRKKHGLDVRIFDRTWILDRVFEGRHEAVAIEDLKLQCSVRTQVRKGSLDVRKESELSEVEERIAAASREGRLGYQLADDCIEAVTLARSLERPRTEIDGLLARAERLAQQCGTSHQQLVAAYQHAWTAFWWFEDFPELVRMYSVVEERAKCSDNIYHLELLSNVWHLLNIVVQRGSDESTINLTCRTKTLADELARFSQDESRLSAALQARSMRLMVELLLSAKNDPAPVLRQLKEVIESCGPLIGFALQPLVEILTEIGNVLGDSPAYDELFATIEAVCSKREGELSAARLVLARGTQQLDSDRPVQAIRTLGRALTRLFKNESKDDLIHALYLCAAAYERTGLLWAARGTALTAASLAADDFWTHQDVTPLQAGCYNRLKWLELRLGRVPYALAWHDIDRVVRHILSAKGYATHSLDDGDRDFDGILGILFLRTPVWELKHLCKLPESLEELDLHYTSLALRFALGDEASVAEDLQVNASGTDDELQGYFVGWRDQPAAKDLPAHPQFGDSQKLSLESSVAGCHLIVECQNEPACVTLGESILGVIESLLATGLADRVIAREPVVTLKISSSDFADAPFSFQLLEEGGRPAMLIRCSVFNPHRMTHEDQGKIKKRLLDLVLTLVSRAFFINDAESFAAHLFGDDCAVERAVHFACSFVVLGNVLGDNPRTNIGACIRDDAKEFPLSRSIAWDANERSESRPIASAPEQLRMGDGSPPEELLNPERISHTQIRTVSLIREVLWNRAGWAGTAFIVSPELDEPPILLPVFRDADAARDIFVHLQSDLGARDVQDLLRVSIIRGIRRDNPYAYRIILSSNPPSGLRTSDTRIMAIVSRVHTMEPDSSENLDTFLTRYIRIGRFWIAPCVIAGSSFPTPLFEHRIEKQQLHVRDAWQIGKNDFDMIGVLPDDDPIIPDGMTEPPVAALLAWKRSR
jgi:hypothetical protein